MSNQTVLYSNRGGIAEITLNRPTKLNAFDDQMATDLSAALDQATADRNVRVVLLTGAGRAFSAGQDLADPAISPPDDSAPDIGAVLEHRFNPIVRAIREIEKPVIAAVNGVAAGAAANVALACDVVVAARSATFVQAFIRIGLIPDAGGTYILPRLIGLARATMLMMTGEPVSAEQAEAWGLIWKCVDDDQLMAEAMSLAEGFAVGPTQALGRLKQAIDASTENSLDRQLDLERDLQRLCGRSHDFREGRDAFVARRPARFEGR